MAERRYRKLDKKRVGFCNNRRDTCAIFCGLIYFLKWVKTCESAQREGGGAVDWNGWGYVEQYLPEILPYLQQLEPSTLKRMALKKLPAGTLLYEQEDWDESPLYVSLYGVCKLYCNYESLLFPIYCVQGSVIGTLEALSGDFELRTANMSAFTDTILLSIPRTLLQNEIYDQSRELFFWLMRRTILKYHRSEWLHFLQGDALFKLCSYFCEIYSICKRSTFGDTEVIVIKDTKPRLSISTGSSLRSVGRSISRMKEQGMIETRHGEIMIDEQGYQAMKKIVRRGGA